MNDQYKTLTKKGEGFYKEKGSKFLGFALPCESKEVAKTVIDQLRKEHYGACHVCFAWRFGTQQYEDRFSDDGEPNNSAGKPIFGQLLSYEVTNTLIAVVRYYGGTNLGVGGLITAYKTAAKEALSNAKIEEKFISNYYKLEYDYTETGQIMAVLSKIKGQITEQIFENGKPALIFMIRKSQENLVSTSFESFRTIKLTLLKTV